MKQRIITGIFLFLFLFLFFILQLNFLEYRFDLSILLGFFFIVLASQEMFNMIEQKKKIKFNYKIFILISSVIVFLFSLLQWSSDDGNNNNLENGIIQYLSIFVLFVILILLIFFVIFDSIIVKDLEINFIIIFYISIGTSSFFSIFLKNPLFFWYIILITVLTDSFSFLTGFLFGKKKIFPNISPNKTLEGYIYGNILSTFIIFLIYYSINRFLNINFFPIQNPFIFIIVTFFNSIIVQTGDLINSKIKRNYNIKDFGKLLPGHGGLLDRFDSVLFLSLFINFIFKFQNLIINLKIL
ncbi:phosphatidate cytidylyltransferase [Candidatus Phytoplasma mali]|uniref:Phosphatidate cytidylyltransferase n=1 Tax=Phytoplasma mali (strain AT) TaxID=482235 RepID=B3QZN6_PHYMT|nr:phosphatidate cytidylyltransferase [Candidatus Phytoplasma mali]CAP18423.1 phosphatidate cytidylyltransferase [Candidatus Phytoplasma mali]